MKRKKMGKFLLKEIYDYDARLENPSEFIPRVSIYKPLVACSQGADAVCRVIRKVENRKL